MAEFDFDLNGYRGVSVDSFSIRELSFRDEVAAAKRSGDDVTRASIELLSAAISKVNGEKVKAPYYEWQSGDDPWSARTVEFVQKAFNWVNGTDAKEMDDFLSKAASGQTPSS